MKTKQHIKDATANLVRAKLRSFLAVLGVLVGTAAVVALVTCGQGAKQQALSQVQKLGPHLMIVSIHSSKEDLTLSKALALKDHVQGVKRIAPYTQMYKESGFRQQSFDGKIIGTTSEYAGAVGAQLQHGRFLSFLEDHTFHCVVGANVKKQMKKEGVFNPVGHHIRVDQSLFTIVGVLKDNDNPRFDLNSSIIIPATTSLQLSGKDSVSHLLVELKPDTEIKPVKHAIKSYIKDTLHDAKLFLMSPEQIMKTVKSQSQTLTMLLGLIGTISLIVGGIGVMNIMLVSVTERRREIGIRMALGATTKDILVMFLIEAVMLTAFGGVLGVLVGTAAAWVITEVWTSWGFYFFWQPAVISFSIAVLIGIFFGYYPAHKAARLDPIEAMR